jgi:hypothetical protein
MTTTTGPRPGDKNHMSRDTQWLAGMGVAGNQPSSDTNPMVSSIPASFSMSTMPSRPTTPAPGSVSKRSSMGTIGPSGGPASGLAQNERGNGAMGAGSGAMVPMGTMMGMGVGSSAGFFSPMTKVYIGDVLDHLEIIVSNMDQFVATCDHLTDYVFVSQPTLSWRIVVKKVAPAC